MRYFSNTLRAKIRLRIRLRKRGPPSSNHTHRLIHQSSIDDHKELNSHYRDGCKVSNWRPFFTFFGRVGSASSSCPAGSTAGNSNQTNFRFWHPVWSCPHSINSMKCRCSQSDKIQARIIWLKISPFGGVLAMERSNECMQFF